MKKLFIISLYTLWCAYLVFAKPQQSNSSFVGGASASGNGSADGNATASSPAGNASAVISVSSSGSAVGTSYEYNNSSSEGSGTAAQGQGLGAGTGAALGNNASVVIETSGVGNGTGGHQSIDSVKPPANSSRIVDSVVLPVDSVVRSKRQGRWFFGGYPYYRQYGWGNWGYPYYGYRRYYPYW